MLEHLCIVCVLSVCYVCCTFECVLTLMWCVHTCRCMWLLPLVLLRRRAGLLLSQLSCESYSMALSASVSQHCRKTDLTVPQPVSKRVRDKYLALDNQAAT